MKTGRKISFFSFIPVLLAATVAIGVTFLGPVSIVGAQDEFKYGGVMPVTGPIPQYGEYYIRGTQ